MHRPPPVKINTDPGIRRQHQVSSTRPLVGIGVVIIRDGKVLLGKRKGAHGAGHWALPGGHLEFGEGIADCAAREVLEETGLSLTAFVPGPYTSHVFEDIQRHYITLFVIAECSGEPQTREPNKCEGWHWCDWSNLPQPLFAPLAKLHASGYVPTAPG